MSRTKRDGSALVPDELTEEEAAQASGVATTLLGFLVLAGVLVVVAGLGYRIYPAHRPKQAEPSFVDIIFANNLVVFGARVILFSAALVLAVTAFYIIYSMVISMRAGRPLEQFGPLRVQAVQDLTEHLEAWQTWWAEANEENADLRSRLEHTDALVADLLDENERLLQGEERPRDEKDSDL